jgi:hypothetical protein
MLHVIVVGVRIDVGVVVVVFFVVRQGSRRNQALHQPEPRAIIQPSLIYGNVL